MTHAKVEILAAYLESLEKRLVVEIRCDELSLWQEATDQIDTNIPVIKDVQ